VPAEVGAEAIDADGVVHSPLMLRGERVESSGERGILEGMWGKKKRTLCGGALFFQSESKRGLRVKISCGTGTRRSEEPHPRARHRRSRE
jgi:hypothetical protein